MKFEKTLTDETLTQKFLDAGNAGGNMIGNKFRKLWETLRAEMKLRGLLPHEKGG